MKMEAAGQTTRDLTTRDSFDSLWFKLLLKLTTITEIQLGARKPLSNLPLRRKTDLETPCLTRLQPSVLDNLPPVIAIVLTLKSDSDLNQLKFCKFSLQNHPPFHLFLKPSTDPKFLSSFPLQSTRHWISNIPQPSLPLSEKRPSLIPPT